MNSVRVSCLLFAALLATFRAAKIGAGQGHRGAIQRAQGHPAEARAPSTHHPCLSFPWLRIKFHRLPLAQTTPFKSSTSELQLQDFPKADLATGEAAADLATGEAARQTDLSGLLGVQLDQPQTAEDPVSSLSASAPNESQCPWPSSTSYGSATA